VFAFTGSGTFGAPQGAARNGSSHVDCGSRPAVVRATARDRFDAAGRAQGSRAGAAEPTSSPTVAEAPAKGNRAEPHDGVADRCVATGSELLDPHGRVPVAPVEQCDGPVTSPTCEPATAEAPSEAGHDFVPLREPAAVPERAGHANGQPAWPARISALLRNAQPVVTTNESGAADDVGIDGLPFDEASGPAEESVLVRETVDGVDVTVRHATLEPHAAIWYAMQTAEQLAGNRRALHQVTLNGRKVYHDERRSAGATGSVRFHC